MLVEPKDNQPTLFRKEVFDAKNQARIGAILLTPKLSFLLISFLAFVIAALLIAFMVFGSYTRRTTVSGQLVPISGLIRILSPQAGIVLEKHVAEGQHVKQGDVLYVLTSDRVGLSSNELQADISKQIAARTSSMQSEISRNIQAAKDEAALMTERMTFLRNEADTIKTQMTQQKERVALAVDTHQRYRGLAEKDYIANEQLVQKEMELSEQQSRLQVLARDLLVNSREQATTRRELGEMQTRFANQNAQLQRTISTARQETTEVESKSRVVITAPQAGTATLVTTEIGQAIDGSKQLMSLVPDNSGLEARLYAPSSAIGFINKGDRVLLRYQAYPYQKFGLYEGSIKAISDATVSNLELSGITIEGMLPTEPVYGITVSLNQQYANINGAEKPLLSGMRLEADILQEKRRLYEWLLEPIYSARGKLSH